jgi:HD-like signal output (HDOD) protein
VAARVLRVANSAFFGCSGTVSTLDRAVQVLGLQGIKGAAAAACMDRMIGSQAASAGFDADAFRRHSLATACLAARLSKALDAGLDEEAFMAGLLHDLGLVVQWRLRPQGMQALRRALAAGQVPEDSFSHAEQHHVGTTHERCTAIVLEAWQLPPALVHAVAHHESALLAERPELPSLLRCADSLATHLDLGLALEDADLWPWREALARWGLDEAAVARLQQGGRDEALSLLAALQD